MTSLKAMIVDDEPLARRRLRALLKGHPDVEVVAECGSGREAVAAIRRKRPDVLFLDIQMPGMDGFDLIREIGVASMPPVVFVTAYEEHALRAFEVNALDYLLKPFDERRFAAALARVRRLADRDASAWREQLREALRGLKAEAAYPARLAVKSNDRIQFVPVDEIEWIGASGKHVRIHTRRGEHLRRTAISQIETLLDPRRFVRIHRSTVVNVERIKELQPLFHGEYAVILHGGAELTLSRGYRGKLRELLGFSDDGPVDRAAPKPPKP